MAKYKKDKDLEEFEGELSRLIDEAENWRKEHVEPDQELATDYYMGRPFGDEIEGRSQVVMTEVRDVVRQILPSLLRIFCGPDKVVEFKPVGPEDVPLAAQQTEYINHIFQEDNQGFLVLHSVFKDALVRKLGVVKAWWEVEDKTNSTFLSGLTQEDLAVLQAEEGVELEDLEELTPPDPTFPVLFNAKLTRKVEEGKVCIQAVPPEEFVFSPSARSLDDARIVAHVRYVRAEELRDMGVPEDMIEEAGYDADVDEGLAASRRVDQQSPGWVQEETDEDSDTLRLAEVYQECDFGEGKQLYKILALGSAAKVWKKEPVSRKPFALFCPDPEPHTLIGLGTADLVMDLQRINSQLVRGMLDSLALSINPQTEVVQGQVEMKDILNPSLGRVIRVRQPGMIREITIPFVGGQALPVLEFTQAIRESRTGQTRASAGLDADVLQSTTKAAVQATFTAAQQQIEMLARIFAETGMKDLFAIILELVVQHQDKPKIVRLRNDFVQIDPRYWDANCDVQINVALGAGLTEERLAALSMIAGKQEQMIGSGMPLAGFVEYRNTLAKMTELAGYKDSNEFFKPFGPQEEQQMQEAAANAPKEPTEIEAFLQVEMAKIEQKREEAAAADQREREKAAMDFELKKLQIQVQAATTVDNNDLKRDELALKDEQQENDAILGMLDRERAAATQLQQESATV